MELISREKAIQGVRELFSMGECYCDELNIVWMLNGLPNIKNMEKTAKVINISKPIIGTDQTISVTSCENCQSVVSIFDNYCPYCGALLEWETENP